MSLSVPEQCMRCKHFKPEQGYFCDAYPEFPNVIPDAILEGEADHRQLYPGDHGIRWEPRSPGIKHPLDER